ncbi:MAG: DUF4389 domain-containing protein [Acidimicrobiia bacterium]|nr:DUF4389 domain-containing protein [Acidimicrobiia bacterium]
MRVGRVIALVIGSLLSLAALGMLFGAGAIGLATAVERDDDGYFDFRLDRIESETVAVVSDDITLSSGSDAPEWLFDLLDVEIRIGAASALSTDMFIGIAPTRDVDRYLADSAHDVVLEIDGQTAELAPRSGVDEVEPPTDQDFWTESASGPGTQVIEWEVEGGNWTVVVMNADASAGISADVEVGVRAGVLVAVAFVMLGLGLLLLIGGVGLIVFGALGLRSVDSDEPPAGGADPTSLATASSNVESDVSREPVLLDGWLDPDVSNWQWLVKWLLAIPHGIVLFFLWIAFTVVTIIAGFAILFTGRYPRGLFDFCVGVLRWTWRVSFYAFSGGLGTDRYPPFTLADDPSYPARLNIEYPRELSRGLVLVKWWLLAIPHYIVLGVFFGGSAMWVESNGDTASIVRFSSYGLLGVLTMIAAIALLFRGRQLRPLFDLIVGLNRWTARVIAYAALMTDRYPPFRLDQGALDPGHPALDTPPETHTDWPPPA